MFLSDCIRSVRVWRTVMSQKLLLNRHRSAVSRHLVWRSRPSSWILARMGSQGRGNSVRLVICPVTRSRLRMHGVTRSIEAGSENFNPVRRSWSTVSALASFKKHAFKSFSFKSSLLNIATWETLLRINLPRAQNGIVRPLGHICLTILLLQLAHSCYQAL